MSDKKDKLFMLFNREQMGKGSEVALQFLNLLNMLHQEKPNDRSPQDRAYAILSTDIEKTFAYYMTYIKMPNDEAIAKG